MRNVQTNRHGFSSNALMTQGNRKAKEELANLILQWIITNKPLISCRPMLLMIWPCCTDQLGIIYKNAGDLERALNN